MNIFDAHVSGSLSVSGSAELSGDLTVLGTINATISGTTSNAISASEAPKYTLTSSFNSFTASYNTGSFNGSFVGNTTGSFIGDGAGLYNIPASGVTGLNLTKIISGSISASLNSNGFNVNTDTSVAGTLNVQGGITGSADFNTLVNKPTLVSGSSQVSISDITGYSAFSSSISSSLGILSSSISETDLNQTNRIGNLEVSTGSLNSFTSSIDTTIKNRLNSEGVISGSVQVQLTGTTGYSTFSSSLTNDLSTLSSSIATTDLSQNNRLNSLETSTGSINTLTSSVLGRINNIESTTSSLNSFTSSQNIHNDAVNTFTSSVSNRINSIETSTGSLNTFTSSIDTTIKNKLNVDGVVSGSSQIVLSGTTGFSTVSASLSSLSSSISITNLNQDSRLNGLEEKTGSYTTTGSNVFVGSQVITGSVTITQNLNVLGSSSFLIVTSSQLALSSSFISVNVFEPAERFGGLRVYDSGSSAATASMMWDSLNNKWIYQNASGSSYSGGMFMMGPRNTGALGEEVGTIANVIMKGMGGDHISGSNIKDDGTTVSVNSNTEITGSLIVTSTISSTNITSIESTTSSLNSFTSSIDTTIKNKLNSDGVISGSSQVLNGSGIWSGSAQLPAGVVSGSSQVSYLGLSNIPSGIVSGSSQIVSLLPTGTVSGSSQVSFNGITDKPTLVSGSSQITYSNLTGIPSGIVSGSSQITYGSISGIPIGIVSGSSQVLFSGITGVPSGLVSGSSQILLSSGIWSGSAQLPSGIVSGSSQISYGSISGIPSGIVSGSSQISFGSVSGVPSGLVSGSSQISFGSVTGVPSGLVSGSGQITYSSISGIPSGLVSGSSQITYSSISGIPSGIVSGSSQITLSSTTGFGTYLNQAVLTTSAPTFAGLTSNNNATLYRDVYINGGTGGSYGNRLLIGDTTATYTLQDTNLRPTIYMSGAYPVLTLNHTVTSNGSHGPTIQFTHYTADKQWVIGTNGTGTRMDFGYSTNTNRNPHNGIDNYQGNTYLRIANDGNITTWSHFIPASSAALDLGTSSLRWRTIYTSDLSLSNGIGDYTIVEGENDLFLYNNKQNKVYKFMLQEVNPEDATPKLPS